MGGKVEFFMLLQPYQDRPDLLRRRLGLSGGTGAYNDIYMYKHITDQWRDASNDAGSPDAAVCCGTGRYSLCMSAAALTWFNPAALSTYFQGCYQPEQQVGYHLGFLSGAVTPVESAIQSTEAISWVPKVLLSAAVTSIIGLLTRFMFILPALIHGHSSQTWLIARTYHGSAHVVKWFGHIWKICDGFPAQATFRSKLNKC